MRKANNAFNQTYHNMTLAKRGDTVFSFANAKIGAVGRVTEEATLTPKPGSFRAVANNWADEGWLVEVDFQQVPTALRPQEHIGAIRNFLPERHSPVKKENGHGNEVYLTAISDELGEMLVSLLRIEADPLFASPLPELPTPEPNLLADIEQIKSDASISETQRVQLAKARIGQGYFRKQVLLINPRCRVTGVEDSRLLIASHIKPWKDSNNAERIDGSNGIMLSPHFDSLFDSHLISFEDEGKMLFHRTLSNDVLERWAIRRDISVGRFAPEQSRFLEHHRNVFLNFDE